MHSFRSRLSLPLGVKLLFGVALISNCFMGLLLSSNHLAAAKADQMVGELLTVREQLGDNLRTTIIDMQEEFRRLPELFHSDPTAALLATITAEHQVLDQWILEGRKSYGPQFTRTQKRDIAKGKLVITVHEGRLLLTAGLFDEQGQFLANVQQQHLQSPDPAEEKETLEQLIRDAYANQDDQANLVKSVAQLKQLVADKGIEAEQTRTEILDHVDQLNTMTRQMEEQKKHQQRLNLSIAAMVIIGNMIALFFLTRIIVERPLGQLTTAISALGRGEYPEIPMLGRRDQIGVLSTAIDAFGKTLKDLERRGVRQKKEQQIINRLIHSTTDHINSLDTRARNLTETSLTLEKLALITEQETGNASTFADSTATHTGEVAKVAGLLSETTRSINDQMEKQDAAMDRIVQGIETATQQLEDLGKAVSAIDTIISTVYKITDQTKILALNATIEAVKAGDRGKGFAVVAQEVKLLSLETAKAASEIMEKVRTIDGYSQTFITFFTTLENNADELRQITDAIGTTAAAQQQHITDIANLSVQASGNTRQVNDKIKDVNAATANMLELCRQAHASSESVSRALADLLRNSTEQLGAVGQGEETAEPTPSPTDGGQQLTQMQSSAQQASGAVTPLPC